MALLPGAYHSQATTLRDIAVAATVSLIDPVKNQTIATALTNPAGQFVFDFGRGFAPEPGAYILEAVKGLAGNRAGNPAVRVRTVIQWQGGGGWQSMTGGGVTVNRATTAICIAASLRGVSVSGLLGKVQAIPDQPSVFDPSGTGLTLEEYEQVLVLVDQALEEDRDPVDSIIWNPLNGFVLKVGSGGLKVEILEMFPLPASAGGTLTIVGTNIGEAGILNFVKFADEATASLTAVGSRSITVLIPHDALPGILKVSNPFGEATADVSVISAMAGIFGPAGGAAVIAAAPEDTPQPPMIGGFAPDGEYIVGYNDPARVPGPKPTGPIPDISGGVNPKGNDSLAPGDPAPALDGGFDPCPDAAPCPAIPTVVTRTPWPKP